MPAESEEQVIQRLRLWAALKPPMSLVKYESVREVIDDAATVMKRILERPTLTWQPIESAPRDGTMIIVPGGIAYWRERLNHWEGPACWMSITGLEKPGRPIQWKVTCWMPFPSPPPTASGESPPTPGGKS